MRIFIVSATNSFKQYWNSCPDSFSSWAILQWVK